MLQESVGIIETGEKREFEARTYAKVTRRIVPFLMLCYFVAFLDRVNVGFAKLQMSTDLHFSKNETARAVGATF